MVNKIIWSDEAENNLAEIVSFILLIWNDKILTEFFVKLNYSINKITEFPLSFPESDKKTKTRKCVIANQVSLFYTVNNKEILIKALFDNRQNPDKLKI